MTGDQKDELVASQDQLIAELVFSLETTICWALQAGEQLKGDPEVRDGYLKDMVVACAIVEKAHGAK